jgi:hypothetical protein
VRQEAHICNVRTVLHKEVSVETISYPNEVEVKSACGSMSKTAV